MDKQSVGRGRPILPVPPLPVEIREAVNNRKLAVFLGAGVSRILGCMGWDRLADKLAEVCYEKGYITFNEKEVLSNYVSAGDRKKVISICKHTMEDRDDIEAFYSELTKAVGVDPKRLSEFPIYAELYRFRALFITTNFDDHFDKLFYDESIAFLPQHFDFNTKSHTRLYHLHGSIKHTGSLVLTLQDYFHRYRDSGIENFLRSLFQEFQVLFVGYGLAEFELLDYLMIKHSGQPSEQRHFYLMPLYSYEDSILAFERSYFSDMGIQVLH